MRGSISIILVIVILVIAALTNPGIDQFINYVLEANQGEETTELERFFNQTIGESLLEANTDRTSYLLFSIFELGTTEEQSKHYLGIFSKIFIPLD